MGEYLGPDFGENVVRNALDLWINPEINRRREAGTLPENFSAYAIQVIFDDDLECVQVRLNEEVRAVLEVDFTRDIKAGDAITISDIGDVKRVQLTKEDPNAGHFTLIRKKEGWTIAFDFTRNVTRSHQYLDAANEFLKSAEFAFNNKYFRAFIDNLHSTAELVAKGLLIMHDSEALKSKKHGQVSGKYNLWGCFGNINVQYTKLLNLLQKLRKSARYLEGDLTLTPVEAKDMLTVAEAMVKDLEARIAISKRAESPQP
jgi:uncharacterized protein (UPF0332 family)